MVNEQQTFISQTSRRWRVQNHGANRLVYIRTHSLDGHLSTVTSHGERREGALQVSFIRALIQFLGSSTLIS